MYACFQYSLLFIVQRVFIIIIIIIIGCAIRATLIQILISFGHSFSKYAINKSKKKQ